MQQPSTSTWSLSTWSGMFRDTKYIVQQRNLMCHCSHRQGAACHGAATQRLLQVVHHVTYSKAILSARRSPAYVRAARVCQSRGGAAFALPVLLRCAPAASRFALPAAFFALLRW